MPVSFYRQWRTVFLACTVILLLFTCNTDCFAKSSTVQQHKHQLKHQKKYDQMSLQLKQMQKTLDVYNQRLQDMQSTIDTLKAQISKTKPVESGDINKNTSQSAITTKDASDSAQDIGTQLIFDSKEQTSTSDENIKNVASLSGRIQTGAVSSTQSKELPGRVEYKFNPDIMVSGDFLGNIANKSSISDRNRFSLREAEFGFSAAIDPYSKGTIIFAKPEDESLEIEEGYVTLMNMPFGLQSKVGKFRNSFGKLNTMHTHDLPQLDRPDVLTNFFGEEGLVNTGISVSKILPSKWYSDINLEVTNGDTDPLFNHGNLSRPLITNHWKNFFNISENKSFEIGLSSALGYRDVEDDKTRISAVQGADMTYNWIPANQLHLLKWQTEFLAAELANKNNEETDSTSNKNAYFGGYSFLQYKLNNRWSIGSRVDYSQVPLLANASEWAFAPYIDYNLSEFGRVRLEYKHTFGHNLESSDRAWLQYSIIMGTHPAHTL